MLDPQIISQAFIDSCEGELLAPKPGNVHIFAEGHGMTAQDFISSSAAAAPFIAQPGLHVGQRILGAVQASFAAVAQNTNLGIILLCAPLAHAALNAQGPNLRIEARRQLHTLDQQDAADAYQAISLAAPAGLGTSKNHDVRGSARTTLRGAMEVASPRDRIAWQYIHDFDDIFNLGLPTLREARQRGQDAPWSTLTLYLTFLRAFPDSHVARKYGTAAAETLYRDAQIKYKEINDLDRSEAFAAALSWDHALKQQRLNPGTSADLTVASLFADRLAQTLANAPKNG